MPVARKVDTPKIYCSKIILEYLVYLRNYLTSLAVSICTSVVSDTSKLFWTAIEVAFDTCNVLNNAASSNKEPRASFNSLNNSFSKSIKVLFPERA